MRRSSYRRLFIASASALGLVLAVSAPAADKLPWSPEQATGEPDTATAGDVKTAWATREQNKGEEWIALEYKRPVAVHAVRIRETFNPGAIRKVVVCREQVKSLFHQQVNPPMVMKYRKARGHVLGHNPLESAG